MKNQQRLKPTPNQVKKSSGVESANDASDHSKGHTRTAILSPFSCEMKDCFYAANSSRIAQRTWDEVFTLQDKVQLGETLVEAYKCYEDLTEMWVKVRGGTLARAAVDILFTLEEIGPQKRRSLLQQLGEEGEDNDATVDLAIMSGYLVLADAPRQAYWEKKQIDITWEDNPAMWEYLLAVCKASKSGDRLDPFTFVGGARTLTNRKNRLLKTVGFPSTLASRFGKTRGTANTLNLLPAQIRIFERTIQEDFREWEVGRATPR